MCIHIYIYIYIHIHIHIYIYIYIYIYVYMCMCVCVYVYVCICVCIGMWQCVCVYESIAHMHIPHRHTHTHTHTEYRCLSKQHSVCRSLCPATQQQKLLSCPWVGVFRASYPEGCLLWLGVCFTDTGITVGELHVHACMHTCRNAHGCVWIMRDRSCLLAPCVCSIYGSTHTDSVLDTCALGPTPTPLCVWTIASYWGSTLHIPEPLLSTSTRVAYATHLMCAISAGRITRCMPRDRHGRIGCLVVS